MSKLFEPFTLNNGVTIKNRLVVAPMTHWASDENGHITDTERSFLAGRAEDFGLFIAAATLVYSTDGKSFEGEPHAINKSDLPSLKEVAQIIHSQGAKAILQLHHGGKTSLERIADRAAPSAAQEIGEAGPFRAFSEEEVEKLIAGFGYATELAILAGFDGVEIHGANGFVIQQFYSPHSNRRTDKWGQNRLNFPMAVVDAVVAARTKHQRDDFIIGYRFSPEEPEERGITMKETFALVDALKEKPLQYLHVSLWDFYKNARRGADTTRTRIEQLHERIGGKLPLIGVGNLFTGEQIEQAMATGWAEFIGLGKAVLLNRNIATLLKTDNVESIETTLDPARGKEYYGYSERLWQMNMAKLAFLPPLKEDKNWRVPEL